MRAPSGILRRFSNLYARVLQVAGHHTRPHPCRPHAVPRPVTDRLATILLAAVVAWQGDAAFSCRQALTLGLDVSGSVDATEYRLQLNGLADALDSESVRRLLLRSPETPVLISIFEWSGIRHQELVLGWTAINGSDTLDAIIGRLRGRERPRGPFTTAIGAAIRFGSELLDQVPHCWRHTLDLSGDGKNNIGIPPSEARRHAGRVPFTVNGLVIGGHDERLRKSPATLLLELNDYYLRNVITGPGAFVEVASGYNDFERAMTKKLLRELAGVAVSARPSRTTNG